MCPLKLVVSEVIYREGDPKGRFYTDVNGKLQFRKIPLYAVRDVDSLRRYYRDYIDENAADWFYDMSKSSGSKWYAEAWRLYEAKRVHIDNPS